MERKENKKVYAMKYVNKESCLKQRAVDNVVAEVDLLRSVDHPFIVSLWFTFQVSTVFENPFSISSKKTFLFWNHVM